MSGQQSWPHLRWSAASPPLLSESLGEGGTLPSAVSTTCGLTQETVDGVALAMALRISSSNPASADRFDKAMEHSWQAVSTDAWCLIEHPINAGLAVDAGRVNGLGHSAPDPYAPR